jgi:hypothetical protein
MATWRQARGGTLILGGGFAESYVARLLGKAGATIVSPENFVLYTPILPEPASGTCCSAGRPRSTRKRARMRTETLVWTAGVKAHPLAGIFGLPLDERGGVRVDQHLRVGGAPTSGRSATAPPCPTPRRPADSTRPRASTPFARRIGWRETSPATRSRTATGCSARSPRSAATTASPTSWDSACVGSPAGSSRGRTLYQLPLLSRKLRVVVDWTTSLFFRRDVAELSGLGHPRPARLAPSPSSAGTAPVRPYHTFTTT